LTCAISELAVPYCVCVAKVNDLQKPLSLHISSHDWMVNPYNGKLVSFIGWDIPFADGVSAYGLNGHLSASTVISVAALQFVFLNPWMILT
jgi:hypothetical protein